MAAAELASISERRIERLVNPKLSGLPAFLVNDSGLNSGFMIAQYTAAALVSENKVLSHPACVDSIPTSANKEDHVSMGTISVRKCRSVITNAENVIAIELLCGCQALDLLTKGKTGKGTEAAYRVVRERVPGWTRTGSFPATSRRWSGFCVTEPSCGQWRRLSGRWLSHDTALSHDIVPDVAAILFLHPFEPAGQLRHEKLSRRSASQHQPGQRPKLRGIAGEAVRLTILVDLEEVLHTAQEQVVG